MDSIKINRKLRFLALSVLTGMFVLGLAGDSFAQGRYSDRYSRVDVDRIIRNMEQNSDEFRTDFRREMNNSNLNSSTRNRFNGYVATMENSVDDLRRHFDRNDSWWESRSRVQSVVNSSQNVNTMMRTLPFRRSLERQWNQLRNQINRVADTFDLPGLDGGGWQGGPWNPGNPGLPGGTRPPNWAVGTFYGRHPQFGGTIVLTIDNNGRVTSSYNEAVSYGTYSRSNIYMESVVASVSRVGNGIRTRGSNGEIVHYTRNNPGPGWGDGGGSGNAPSWAVGNYWATDPRTRQRINLVIYRNGRVTSSAGGSTSYGTMNGSQIYMEGVTVNVQQVRNGIRTTRVDTGEVVNYRRN